MISTACHDIMDNWFYPTTQEQEGRQTEICYTVIRNTGEKKPLDGCCPIHPLTQARTISRHQTSSMYACGIPVFGRQLLSNSLSEEHGPCCLLAASPSYFVSEVPTQPSRSPL